MSFANTKTPTLSEIRTDRQRYHVPMRETTSRGVNEYYLTPFLEAEFRRLFPKESNRTIMELFGISFSTLQRFKRELGLKKDMKVIRHKQAIITKRICEKNGYYDSLRGKPPSEASRDGIRRFRATHPHPLHILKEKNPRKYKAVQRRMSRNRKELIEMERKRYDIGLLPISNLPEHIYSGISYNRYQIHIRSMFRKWGYIIGSHNPKLGERMFIYYDEKTQRHPIAEKNAVDMGGFEFRPLRSRGKVLDTISTVRHNGFGEE